MTIIFQINLIMKTHSWTYQIPASQKRFPSKYILTQTNIFRYLSFDLTIKRFLLGNYIKYV